MTKEELIEEIKKLNHKLEAYKKVIIVLAEHLGMTPEFKDDV